MKIACRGGHNAQAQGANSILNEVIEDRQINASVIKFLNLDKNEVIDVTPGNCISAIDLAYGVNKANCANVSLLDSNHLNAGGGHGVEVLYYNGSATSKEIATRVCNNIAKLGFTNRGAKADVRGLYELKNTKMPAIIVEAFFLDSASDVALYRKLGVDAIGKAIAEGITGHSIIETITETFSVRNNDKVVKTFDNLYKAKDFANLHPGYRVYDNKNNYKYMLAVVKPVTPPVEAPQGQLYKIQAGAYKSKVEADKAVAELKAKGIDSFSKLV